MTRTALLAATALTLLATTPALAQNVPQDPGAPAGTAQNEEPVSGTTAADGTPATSSRSSSGGGDIVVTAQRTSERLQDVPIAVSAFSAESLQQQQVENTSDLQLSLPNVTFTKSNFTGASFTIRGVGDLCVGSSCDSATGIHVNDIPLLSTRLFETEFFDLERVEVLRGPQGTLYGRNATSGVVNFITARPDLSRIAASGSFEYGNYNSIRVGGMLNLPVTETIGVRVAGYYLNRDGYTKNLFDNSRIDDRDLYALRGTLRFEPSADTTVDIIGYYFREKDNRARSQKQLCNYDPTAILGCSPDRLEFEPFNGNSTVGATLSSRQLFAVSSLAAGGTLGNFGINDLRGPDIFAGALNPADLRTVNTDVIPTYFAEEIQILGKLEHSFGDVTFGLSGGWTRNKVDSFQDYTITVANPFSAATLARANAARATFPLSLGPVVQNNQLCASFPDSSLVGVFGGKTYGCAGNSIDVDRSRGTTEQWSVEPKISTAFDGPFNFLIGGIYVDQKVRNGDYYVVSTGLDYAAAVLGAANGGNGAFLAPSFFNTSVDEFRLKSYGVFGEAYFEASDRLKLTIGARYSNDKKFTRSRGPLLSVGGAVGTTSFDQLAGYPAFDADPSIPGAQGFRDVNVKFDDITGRVVLDYKITPDNLLYASYSRGYKSGGINPPFDPLVFTAPVTFQPENINAFEIGSKNTFGRAQINLSAFYYDYKNLQISRILARTSFNDNTDAEIYGVELESILRPTNALQFNINASYLHTRIKGLTLTDPRDPSGGRADVTIIKDVQQANHCVLVPTGAVRGDSLVQLVNGFLNAATGTANGTALFAPTTVPVPGTNARGAFSSCSLLTAAVAGVGLPTPLATLLAANGLSGRLPFAFDPAAATPQLPSGVALNLSGNELPNSPRYKVSVGSQYSHEFDSGMSFTARLDYNFTGEFYARPQNRLIDRIPSFDQINAQIQLTGADSKWFVRAFVQNLENDDSITGQYLTDPSSGLFTNVFTLEPRRYGAAVGFSF